MKGIRIELSSKAFGNSNDSVALLKNCRSLCRERGVAFGVQLHNTTEHEEIAFFTKNSVPLSVHSPLEQPYNWNFATKDMGDTWGKIDENVRRFRDLAVDLAVFHGFFMTDLPCPAFGRGKTFHQCLGPLFRPEFARWEGKLQNGEFLDTAEYLERRERVKRNLALLRAKYPDITFCIENDYPYCGTGSLLPRDLAYYEHPLCLDTGHLWCTARLYKRDFFAAANAILATGRVAMLHLHASKYDDSYPDDQWSDGHQPLSIPNAAAMRLREISRNAAAAGVRIFLVKGFYFLQTVLYCKPGKHTVQTAPAGRASAKECDHAGDSGFRRSAGQRLSASGFQRQHADG